MKTFIILKSSLIIDTYYYDVVLVAKDIASLLNVDVDDVSLTPVNLLENVWLVEVALCTDDVKRDLHILYDACMNDYSTVLFNE